jgi:hypothetical protein
MTILSFRSEADTGMGMVITAGTEIAVTTMVGIGAEDTAIE